MTKKFTGKINASDVIELINTIKAVNKGCAYDDDVADMIVTRDSINNALIQLNNNNVPCATVSTVIKNVFEVTDYEVFDTLTDNNVIIKAIRYYYSLKPCYLDDIAKLDKIAEGVKEYKYVLYTELLDKGERWYYGADNDRNNLNEVAMELHQYDDVNTYRVVIESKNALDYKVNNLFNSGYKFQHKQAYYIGFIQCLARQGKALYKAYNKLNK